MKPLRWCAIVGPALVVATAIACSQHQDHGPLQSSGPPGQVLDPDTFVQFPDGPRPDVRRDVDADAGESASLDAPDATESLDASESLDGLDALGVGETFDGDLDAETSDAPELPTIVDECGAPLTTSTGPTCGTTVQSWPIEGNAHYEPGTPIVYCTKPPSSGPHYWVWAAFQTYDRPIPWGYFVHDLEHGAVVVVYKCASGSCPTIAAKLQAVIDARPVDPGCEALEAGVRRRVILAPDPTLDIDVAASAWGWTYRATCVDATSLGAFIDAHYGHAAEDFCSGGTVPP